MKYFKKIIGSKCYLSPICVEDAEKYCKWVNDLPVAVNLGISHLQYSLQNEKSFLEQLIKDNAQIFAIITEDKDQLIGNVQLFKVNHIDQIAEFGIMIGDKSYWHKGYGTEATQLIISYGFQILNLQNIMLKVFSFNRNAIQAYQKIGFKNIGVRRKAKLIKGKRFDELYMDITPDDFSSPYMKSFLAEE